MQNKISVIYEDKNFLAVYKPAGLLVHAPKVISKSEFLISKQIPNYKFQNSKQITLVDWLIKNYPEVKNVGDAPEIRPGIVHRLDKDVSGVILVARNQKYFEYLKNLFAAGQIKKNYLALVYGEVKEKPGVIDKKIYLKPGTTKRSVWKGKMGKQAITEYHKITNYQLPITNESFSLLEVSPKTGRTHQIRVHLASIGHPIVGDTLYGKKANPFGLKRIFLHAASLEFPLENGPPAMTSSGEVGQGRRMKIEAEAPEELGKILDKLTNR